MRKLVVYYSLDGNTKFISENIAQEISADILELKPVKEITRNNFMKIFSGGKQSMMKAEPEIQPFDLDPSSYDTIIIGTPVWAWTFAPALRTFFSKIELKNKQIGIFCCHGGGPGKIFEKMEKKLEGNTILGKIGFKDPLKHEKEKDASEAKKWAREIIDSLSQ
ncbi:MAG: flavodoxin [Candidatus Delongbacteria bacterium]|nr:flavodoxin [Candidatus Delongbacteria bacterium]